MKNILFILLLFLGNSFFSQTLDCIELKNSNSIIIGSEINIKFRPLRNNKKGKVRVTFEDKNNYFTKRISAENYRKISQNILSIKEPIYESQDSIRTTCIDGSDTHIIIFQNNIKKEYHFECISTKDKNDVAKKDFWNAAKLIMETVKMQIEDLY